MSGIELKPCPFCGGEADISQDHTVDENHAYGCRKCDIWFDTFNSSDAIAAWNSRVTDPYLTAALAQSRAETQAALAGQDHFRRNLRETFEAMCAMRDSINEHIPMPSLESDLLQGPENSIFCATVAEAVIAAIQPDTSKLALVRDKDADMQALVQAADDVVCGRGMFGVDAASDLEWAVSHIGAALALITAQEEPRHD